MTELEIARCPDCARRQGWGAIDFVRRLRRSIQSGADGNLSTSEQRAVFGLLYLFTLASWVNMTLLAPFVGAYSAGLLTAVLFYTWRDRVRLEYAVRREEAGVVP